jgi:hypothetical protein
MSEISPSSSLQGDSAHHQTAFAQLGKRFASLLKGRRSDEDGFRAARAYAAIAVERYAECSHEGIHGFSKRIWTVVRGPESSVGRLRRNDPDVAEEADQTSLRHWILVLHNLSAKHRKAGLPGPNVIGGGRMKRSRRPDEIEVKGVYYSPLRWRQLAEDSSAACMVLSKMARCASIPANDDPSQAKRAELDRAEPSVSLSLEPSLLMSVLFDDLKKRKAVMTDRTVRRWFQRWREKSGAAAHPQGRIPLTHIAALASWLEAGQSTCKDTVPILRQIVESRISGQVADRLRTGRSGPDIASVYEPARLK